MINLKIFSKAEIPKEGEIREYKDGDYRFTEGHWKKIKKEEEEKKEKQIKNKEPIVELFEKSDMEYPVYKVTIGDKEYFIQRSDEMNSGYSWYEVEKYKEKDWHLKKYEESGREKWLGFDQKEAIETLKREFEFDSQFQINDKVNFKYDNQNYKAKVIEDNGDLVKIEMIDEIEIIDKDNNIHRMKPGYRFLIGKKTLTKI